MQDLPKKLHQKLEKRVSENAYRSLGTQNNLIDFSSNDYLGFGNNTTIFQRASEVLNEHQLKQNGATGSRLLSGNHALYATAETTIATFHKVDAALIFNSGYDANLGFFSAVPQRGDLIFHDDLCHASIRDGIAMSHAKAYKFAHNDLSSLSNLINKVTNSSLPPGEMPERQRGATPDQNTPELSGVEIYIVTESVFSMDGDAPDLKAMTNFCHRHGFHLVVDEAHAIGAVGSKGEGIVQQLGLEQKIFARLVTFGKALGCHGAAILGSTTLKDYLINFARSFIYTTALPPHSVATIVAAYEYLQSHNEEIRKLHSNILFLQNVVKEHPIRQQFVPSNTAIQCCIVPGNDFVKQIAKALQAAGFDVKPILSPTVPSGQERLRICLHSFNTGEEIKKLVSLMTNLL